MARSAVFLQVRLASSRLPRKAFLKLAGKTVIEHAMEALAALETDRHLIVTDGESAPALLEMSQRCAFEVFAGDADDVLKRFVDAAHAYRIDTIVRATGDNPLVSAQIARRALTLYHDAAADYAGVVGTPLGTGVEILRTAALAEVLAHSTEQYDHEHVSPGLYRNPDRFRIATETAPAEWHLPDMRVTLDTPADYARLASLFDKLYRGRPIEVGELVAAVTARERHSA